MSGTVSRKAQWIIFGTVNAACVLAVLLFPLYKSLVAFLPDMPCGMVRYLHLYCPACGGTRALDAFLSFDLLASVRYNPIIVIGAGALAVFEFGMIRGIVRGEPRPPLVKTAHLFVVLGMWFAFFAVRNVLLLCGIDLLGDILA